MRLMVSGCMRKGQGSPSRRLSSGSPGSLPRSLAAPSSLSRGGRDGDRTRRCRPVSRPLSSLPRLARQGSALRGAPGPARRLRYRPADALAGAPQAGAVPRPHRSGVPGLAARSWLASWPMRPGGSAPGRPVARSRWSGPSTSRRSDWSVGWRRRSPPPARDCCDRNGSWSCPRRSTGCRKTSGPPWSCDTCKGCRWARSAGGWDGAPPRWPVCCIAG